MELDLSVFLAAIPSNVVVQMRGAMLHCRVNAASGAAPDTYGLLNEAEHGWTLHAKTGTAACPDWLGCATWVAHKVFLGSYDTVVPWQFNLSMLKPSRPGEVVWALTPVSFAHFVVALESLGPVRANGLHEGVLNEWKRWTKDRLQTPGATDLSVVRDLRHTFGGARLGPVILEDDDA